MKVSVRRYEKVRNAIAMFYSLSEKDELLEYDELDKEDQIHAGLIAKAAIELVDGLFPHGGVHMTRKESKKAVEQMTDSVVKEMGRRSQRRG